MTHKQKSLFTGLAASVLIISAGCDLVGSTGIVSNPADAIEGVNPGRAQAVAYAADDIFSLNYDSRYSMNPITTRSKLNLMFGSLVYESLFEVDERFDYVPKLATECTSNDGVTWFVFIDSGILMHDGSLLSAQDVVYSLQRAQRTETYGARLNTIYGISAMSDEMIMITLKYADMLFPALLNIPVIKSGTLNDDTPVGTGPYMLNRDRMTLERFPGHRNADLMPVDTIYLKEYPDPENAISAYEDSVIDLVVNDPTGLSNLGYGTANDIRKFNTTSMCYLGINTESDFLKFANYRYALNYAVDRDYIVREIMRGYGVTSALPFHPASYFFSEGLNRKYDNYDLDTCLTVFNALNIKDHNNNGRLEFMVTGVPIEINIDFIVNDDNTLKVKAARHIANGLSEIGLPVNLRELNWDAYIRALTNGDYDIYFGEIKLTADFDLNCLFRPDKEKNYGNITDPHYGKLIDIYLAAPDEERKLRAEELCKYIYETAPIIPIFFKSMEVLTHRGVVSGLSPTQYDVFRKFEDWTIDLG
ncbi:MAG: ABC transporter substrate-binding protein [Oscillospiraceae bacterium]|nr:ABC transporter substrate-binding protein [Oscillospiraceae bacterium]